MHIHLQAKHILITGGTGALGSAFIKQAAQEGASVYFTYHQNRKRAAELAALGAEGFQVDLGNRADLDRLVAELKSRTRRLDALIHNAAHVSDRTLPKLSVSDWDRVLQVNLDSVYYLTKKFLPFLFKVEGSKIVTIISRIGVSGGFGQANYAASKGALIALTKSLAKELGKKKILVNAVNPGFMRSAMTEGLPESVYEANKSKSVLSTMSDPESVAGFLVYMLSDHFKNVSGQIFHYDSRSLS